MPQDLTIRKELLFFNHEQNPIYFAYTDCKISKESMEFKFMNYDEKGLPFVRYHLSLKNDISLDCGLPFLNPLYPHLFYRGSIN